MRTLLAACCAALAGCGAQGTLLGTASSYLLTASDALATPGREVQLHARLQGGDLLAPQAGCAVRFSRGGKLFKATETDEEGVAAVTFTPEVAGDYRFSVDVSPVGLSDTPPPAQSLLIACRPPDSPLAIVDMDKTIVASGFHTVLIGQPAPMPGSAAVLTRLAKTHTIVYLTHRPDYFGPKSKSWLAANGYPPGPVLLSSIKGFLAGSSAYKTAVLADLRQSFRRIEIGIGDKASDAAAYRQNGLESFLVLNDADITNAADAVRLADSLAQLPEGVHVVTQWPQIAQVMFDGASFPAAAAEHRLRQAATEMKSKGEPASDQQQDAEAGAGR